EKALVKLVEDVEGIEDGNLRNLEQKIYKGVLELGRNLFQCRINQSGEKAPGNQVGECGHKQQIIDYRTKQILTMMGKVEFKRAYYQCQKEKEQKGEQEEKKQRCSGRAPADQIWGIDQRRTTPGVQEAIGYLCARLTFEEAAETFSRFLPLKMTAKQAQNLMEPVGKALAEEEEKVFKALFEQAAHKHTSAQEQQGLLTFKSIERLYIEMDGIMERLRRGTVEMEASEQTRKGDVYRELKVGTIFEAERGRERSELAPEVWIDTPKQGSQRYVARRTAKGDFDQMLYGLACQSGLAQAKQVVILGDGAPWIWKLACEHFPGAVHIVDLYHAEEHVWQVARAVYGPQTKASEVWAKDACDLLVHGKIEALVAAIAALPSIAPGPGESRSVPERAVNYFTTNAERMRYPTFRAQGIHVGSGIAEAACKTVVATRLKRSGMRWTPDGLDALLPLRTCVLNQTYDAFWQGQPHLVA
ncbi:MAG TPA: ISKra4 family transposase, partial [Ktedonobacteraceae bacterium]|nr:ISKra4 family transposase [Ktedonobacteraceae bacterium]